jgi:hypothetical protein
MVKVNVKLSSCVYLYLCMEKGGGGYVELVGGFGLVWYFL